jgi:hypothetical protein
MLACAFSAPAHAQSNTADSERANVLFKKGKLAFNDGKYGDALRIYSEAWQLKQSPDIAANLAQTESELGKHRDAAEHFAFALAHLLPSTTDEQKKALAEGLQIEKKEVGTLRVTLEPSDATLNVDGAPVTLPLTGEIFVEPGEHRCAASREGYESNEQVARVSKGGSQVLWLKLKPLPGTDAPATTPSSASPVPAEPAPSPGVDRGNGERSLVPVFVGGGIAVAGVAVGVAFLLSANSSQSDANRIAGGLMGTYPCGAGTPYAAECSALHDKNSAIDRARTVEGVGFAVAGAAAVGTAVFLLWPHSAATTARAWSPTLAVAPGATSVGFFGRF